ncbi:MAG: DUF11 domain-containing protein [Gammaproteobacteria bacterium]|jgi:uncharacterized repeat protein (TIGR01451 family)|nr:hypothetical protein [Chromatiales bacterium]MDP6414048.1 DUF11 domain-containing protein [Gammaproteobacteria bacterium]MDP6674673.1 DUF11 domain-containing protein [Gammaproteobacteria bacterium]
MIKRRKLTKGMMLISLWLLSGVTWTTTTAQVVLTIEPDSPTIESSCLAFGAAPGSGVPGDPDSGFVPTSPYMGFIYKDIPAFDLTVGDIVAFDLTAVNDFNIELDIEMAATTVNGGTTEAGPFTKVVSNTYTPLSPRGDTINGNFDLRFLVDNTFSFTGGGLIIRFSNGSTAYRADNQTCSQVGVVATSSDTSGYFVQAFWGDEDGISPWSPIPATPLQLEFIGGFQITDATTVLLTSDTLDQSGTPISTAVAGDLITYRIKAENVGQLDATGVDVTVTLDDFVLYVQSTTDPSAAAVPTAGPPATITWSIGALAAGAEATLEIDLDVLFEANNKTITNSAMVTGSDAPAVIGDTSNSDITIVDLAIDLLEKSGGNCFIATAAYGSYLEPEVLVLRQFRDYYLLTNEPGRSFVAWYYRNSPDLAARIAADETGRAIVRILLTPVVYLLKYPLVSLFVLFSFGLVIRSGRKAMGWSR